MKAVKSRMNKWVIFALIVLALSSYVVAEGNAGAAIQIVSPAIVNEANRTQTYIEFNVTGNFTINGTDSVTGSNTTLEWTNQTGTATNITPTQIVNMNASAGFNYSFWNISGLVDGTHRFKAYVWFNQSTNVNRSAQRNITQDDTIPSITFDEPSNGSSISSSGRTITLRVNITDNVIGFVNAACLYELNAVNTTITSCNNLSAVVSPAGGSNTLRIYSNDSNNNMADPAIIFTFSVSGGAGGGSGGGIAIGTPTLPGNYQIPLPVVPELPSAAPSPVVAPVHVSEPPRNMIQQLFDGLFGRPQQPAGISTTASQDPIRSFFSRLFGQPTSVVPTNNFLQPAATGIEGWLKSLFRR